MEWSGRRVSRKGVVMTASPGPTRYRRVDVPWKSHGLGSTTVPSELSEVEDQRTESEERPQNGSRVGMSLPGFARYRLWDILSEEGLGLSRPSAMAEGSGRVRISRIHRASTFPRSPTLSAVVRIGACQDAVIDRRNLDDGGASRPSDLRHFLPISARSQHPSSLISARLTLTSRESFRDLVQGF